MIAIVIVKNQKYKRERNNNKSMRIIKLNKGLIL